MRVDSQCSLLQAPKEAGLSLRLDLLQGLPQRNGDAVV